MVFLKLLPEQTRWLCAIMYFLRFDTQCCQEAAMMTLLGIQFKPRTAIQNPVRNTGSDSVRFYPSIKW